MNYLRDIRGRFTITWTMEKKLLIGLMVACFVIPVGGNLVVYGLSFVPDNLVSFQAEAAEILTGDRLDRKIEVLKDEVLDTLSKCESGGNADVGIVFDTNKKASIGIFQWQITSFQHYFHKKTGVKLTNSEAITMSLIPSEARDLAHYVIFLTEKGGGKDWVNCFNWHKLQDKVDFINKLSA